MATISLRHHPSSHYHHQSQNLSYIKDPRKLSRQQAHWSLFLQDFNIHWQVTPGAWMAPADALFQKDLINTMDDNADTAIIPDLVVIQALDLFLAHHIKSSSSSDPLVLKAIQARMVPLCSLAQPLLTGPLRMATSTLRNECTCHHQPTAPLFPLCINPPPLDMQDVFAPKPLLSMTSGGLACPPLSLPSSLAAPLASRTR